MTAARGPRPEAASGLRGYDENYLQCRRGNLGHTWELVGYFRGAVGEVRRDLVCERCGTERRDRWLRGSGERLPSAYRYAPDYRVEADGKRVGAAEVRLEVIRRATVYANETQMLNHLTGGK